MTAVISRASTLAVCGEKWSSSYLANNELNTTKTVLPVTKWADVPHEAIPSSSFGDGAVHGSAGALVERIHARVDTPGDVERGGAVEVLAGVVVNVGEEGVRVKGS